MVPQTVKKLKPYTLVLSLITLAILYYFFSFLVPFTNNAFVVANVRPVAATVSGYVTDLYVKNEQYVQKGQALFTVFQEPYRLTYKKLIEEVRTAKSDLQGLQHQLQKDKQLLIQYVQTYNKIHVNYRRNQAVLSAGATSKIKVEDLHYDDLASFAKVNMQQQQISLDEKNIESLTHKIKALTYEMNYAKVNLDQTTVYAQSNGRIQNMYLSLGTPVNINKPIFSFVDTDRLYIQANFTEIDLRMVETGSKVYIIPRMYFGTKIYHGRVVSRAWATNRQVTNPKTQLQTVTNDTNNWILLPQRFPVQIELADYDETRYPLPIGATCYVIIKV